jgi:hypothetical protein
MTRRFLSAALVLTLCAQAREASAGACIYDKECPTGYVCDVANGACIVPGYQSSPSTPAPQAGPPNGAAIAVGLGLAVVLIVVGLVLLNQQSQDTPTFLLDSESDSMASQPSGGLVLSF